MQKEYGQTIGGPLLEVRDVEAVGADVTRRRSHVSREDRVASDLFPAR